MSEILSSNEIVLSDYLTYKDFNSKAELNIFNELVYEADPRNTGDIFADVFSTFMDSIIKPEPIWEKTIHENIFSSLFPFLENQVTFGLGKGAYGKYGVLKYTADFYNSADNVIWEIDGESHSTGLQKLKDEKRDLIMMIEFGIETMRITNQQVEELLVERIRKTKAVDVFYGG